MRREDLVAVKVSFVTLGSEGKTIRSRTPDWLCFPCLKQDETWNIPEYDSPGLRTAERHLEDRTPDLDKKLEERKAATDGR
ncbi:hypothetical protein ACFV42_49620 [Streptomyces solisilvae]|uniref:hypothetical protein n=1 Tax=Streptomyces malaysiensis TaxID=92644 RepID=UPI00368BABF1